jgi:hypothetical protein
MVIELLTARLVSTDAISGAAITVAFKAPAVQRRRSQVAGGSDAAGVAPIGRDDRDGSEVNMSDLPLPLKLAAPSLSKAGGEASITRRCDAQTPNG